MRLRKGTSKPRYSLYLDIYYRKGKRKREFLGIYLEPQDDKTYRNEKLKLAENIKAKRMMELANEAHGFPTKEKLNQNFIAYFEKQMNKIEGNSRTAWNNTLIHLKRWCGDSIPFTDADIGLKRSKTLSPVRYDIWISWLMNSQEDEKWRKY